MTQVHIARTMFCLLTCLCLTITPLGAQQSAPAAYPTLTALETTPVPMRDRVELAQRLYGVTNIEPSPVSPVPVRQAGERQVFRANNLSADLVFDVPATLRIVGEHIYLWVEDGAAVDDDTLQALADAFDTRVYPRVRELWGSESSPGIDGDPRIYALFAHGLGGSTAAYVASDHFYPNQAVPNSNEHEMFFFNLDAFPHSNGLAAVESIVAHEFQHMIRTNVQLNEDYWLNEGFSEFTQLYLYGISGGEVVSFLALPSTQLNAWNEDGSRAANYGASLLFLTYFYERFGLEAVQQVSADPSLRGLDAFDNVLRARGEAGVNTLFADWALANYILDSSTGYGYRTLDGLGLSTSPRAINVEYPFLWEGQVSQYATDYFVLSDLHGATALDIALTAPSEIALVPTADEDGEHFWYSNRHDLSNTTLTRAFDLSAVTSATLEYRLWYHIESLWDYGYVMVSDDDGLSWDILRTPHTSDENPHGVAYGPGYTGISGAALTPQWVTESIALDAYAGKQVLVRFEMITDDGITQHGMAIDDIRIPEIGYAEAFESGDGGWESAGWLWIDNRLPQTVWLQAVQYRASGIQVTRWQIPADRSAQTLDLGGDTQQVVIAVSPFAPVTLVPMPYALNISARE